AGCGEGGSRLLHSMLRLGIAKIVDAHIVAFLFEYLFKSADQFCHCLLIHRLGRSRRGAGRGKSIFIDDARERIEVDFGTLVTWVIPGIERIVRPCTARGLRYIAA